MAFAVSGEVKDDINVCLYRLTNLFYILLFNQTYAVNSTPVNMRNYQI